MSIDAVWLGGPPGNRGDNIRSKLSKYGINFVRIYEYLSSDDRFPASTKLVILNVEMCSHGMQDMGKKEAARIHAAFVMGGFGISRMIANLARTGLIDPSRMIEPVDADVDDTNSNTNNDTNKETENMKPFSTSPAQLAPSTSSAPSAPAHVEGADHGSIESQAADALLNLERWPALRPFLLKGIVEALSKEAGLSK
jgi:hypothetical protein